MENPAEVIKALAESFKAMLASVGSKSSFTIDEFCSRNSIGRTKFNLLKVKPRLMEVDGMTRISIEAEADWRRECEKAAESPDAIRRQKKLAARLTNASRARVRA